MAKQGSIKHYRQTGATKVPPSLPHGELAVAKDGTLYVGNAAGAPVQAGIQVYVHQYNAQTKQHNFTGGGENGRALVTAAVSAGDTFAVNGTQVPAYTAADETDELPVGRWASFTFDGVQLNFKLGGSGLDFKVIAAANESALPAVARENTLGVITTAPISGYVVDSTQPATLQEGEVYIRQSTGNSPWVLDVCKNASNTLLVRPTEIKQKLGAALVAKPALVFLNGVWNKLRTTLYERGAENGMMVGSWVGSTENANGSIAKLAGALRMTNGGATWWGGHFVTSKTIDLTPYTIMQLNVSNSYWCNLVVGFKTSPIDYNPVTFFQHTVGGAMGLNTLDISHINGLHHVMLMGRSQGAWEAWVEVSEVHLF